MFKFLEKFLFVFFITQNIVFAGYNDILIADIQYDWINKSDVEKQEIINEISDMLFETKLEAKSDFKAQLKDFLKDKNYKEHYYAASAGYKELGEYNISAFYAKNSKYIYMYAIQNKKDLSKIYYYDALGHLRYVDFINGDYPDYPYYSYQYKINGKPVSAIYFVSKDTQYMYNSDRTFKVVWFKHNMYGEHSKMIIRRTAY